MSVLDYILVGIMGCFAIGGLLRGFIGQVFSIAGIFGGFLLARFYYVKVVELLGLDVYLGDVASFLLTFFAVFLGVKLIGALVEKLVKPAKLSFFNRFCGTLLGVLKGFLISVLVISLILLVYPRGEEKVRESLWATYFLKTSMSVHRYIPEEIREIFQEGQKEGVIRESESPAPSSGQNSR